MPSFQSTLRAALGFVFLAPSFAVAATYVVTRTDDPAPGACAVGDCSLREAVLAANATAGTDTVQLPAGTVAITIGEIVVVDDLVIDGAGIDTTTLQHALPTLLHVEGAALALSDLALDGPPLADDPPQAILADGGASLALNAVRITIEGGSVTVQDGSGPTLDLQACDVDYAIVSSTNGSIDVADGRMGLLILNQGDIDLHMQRMLIDAPAPSIVPAGLAIMTTGDVLVEDTEIVNARQGILVQGLPLSSLVFRRLRYHDGAAPLQVITPTGLTIEDSEFADNTSVAHLPGAIHAGNGAQVNVFGTTFARNTGNGDTGGAVHIESGAHALIVNSTFSANTFTVEAAGNGARGAAIGLLGSSANPPELTLNHVTIVSPTVLPVGVEGSAIGVRGAAANSSTIVLNSILRGSCRFENPLGGSLTNAHGNIEAPGHGCGLDDATNIEDASTASLALGSLGDHGGPTPTYQPGANSIAIAAAIPNFCLPSDQRGYLRPLADGCDAGAVEVGAIDDRIFVDGFEG